MYFEMLRQKRFIRSNAPLFCSHTAIVAAAQSMASSLMRQHAHQHAAQNLELLHISERRMYKKSTPDESGAFISTTEI